jgi:hypothetical protein
VGNSIARRGLAKPKGGIGLKTTGVSRRRFKPKISIAAPFIISGCGIMPRRIATRMDKS